MDYRVLSGGTLAYVGDAYFEVLVRRRLIDEGHTRPAEVNKLALNYVKATSQSEAVERLVPLLDEEEEAIYRRGRNANGLSIPKSADAAQYRRATGLEAVFGWLYLNGREERAKELFAAAYPSEKASEAARKEEI